MRTAPAISMLVTARQQLPRWCELDALAVAPTLTLLVLLLNLPGVWYLSVPLVITSAIGLAYPRVLRTSPYWFVMATFVGTTVYLHWDTADNHLYLFVYWCLALCAAFSLPGEEQAAALRISSRWLLGLCMLLATLWKLATPSYVDGTFFEFTLLADQRFAHFATLTTGLSPALLAENQDLIDLVQHGYQQGAVVNEVPLRSAPGVARIAWALTWWTVAIEGALAALLLAPNYRWLRPWRNAALLVFAASTYSVAHVRGFGWVLMLLGIAQCEQEERRTRIAYFAAFLLIQFYLIPFHDWLV